MDIILFCIVMFLSHFVHGITGFAGALLAMPPSLYLVGYEIAKPSATLVGWIGGVFIALKERKSIAWREVVPVLVWVFLGIIVTFFIRDTGVGQSNIPYYCFGIFLICYGIYCLKKMFTKEENKAKKPMKKWVSILTLFSAGIIHGLFVCGGPLLTAYLVYKLDDKNAFRATVSVIWVALNILIMVDDAITGYWTRDLIFMQLYLVPICFGAMALGAAVYKYVNQRKFLCIVYSLFIISGISLLFR